MDEGEVWKEGRKSRWEAERQGGERKWGGKEGKPYMEFNS